MRIRLPNPRTPHPPSSRCPALLAVMVVGVAAGSLSTLASCSQILGIEPLAQGEPDARGDNPSDAMSTSDATPIDAAIQDATVIPDAPAIDTSCVNATLADVLGASPIDTDTAADTISASCGGEGSGDQVFLWTAPATDYYEFDTFDADFDTVLAFYDECGGTELSCNNNTGAVAQSEIVRKFTAGSQAILVVDGVAGDRGTGTLDIQRVTCPDVDLEGQNLPVEQTTVGFGDDHSATCGGGGVLDRAYHWTAPADGLYYFRATSDSFEPIVSVLEGSRCSDRELGCNTAFRGDLGAEVVRYFQAGESVSVLIDGTTGTSAGLFDLDIGLSSAAACPEAVLESEVTATDFGPRVMAPSCSYANATDGVGSPFEAGDLTYSFDLSAAPGTGSGYCDIIVSSPQEFALSALENGDCSGAELDCILATQNGSPDWTATLRLTMQEEAVQRTIVISDRQNFDTGAITIEVGCAAIAVR